MILSPFLHADPVAISYLFGCGDKLMREDVPPPPRAAELRDLNAGLARA
jgi:hypothetical protein